MIEHFILSNQFLISINFAEESEAFCSLPTIEEAPDDILGKESKELEANQLMHERKVKKRKKKRKKKDLTPLERKKRREEKKKKQQMELEKQNAINEKDTT